MGEALRKLSEEDPTFRVHTDENTGQTIIAGMGELHLDVLVDRMLREFRVQANVGKPRVSYRETITRPVDKAGLPIRQADRRARYVRARRVSKWNPWSAVTVSFLRTRSLAAQFQTEFIPAVEKGVIEAAESGVLAWLSGHRCQGDTDRWFVP